MPRAVADTHTVVWYLYDDARLSLAARTWIEDAAAAGEQIAISAITLAEMIYLIEKGRIFMPDPKPIERTSAISQVNRPLLCGLRDAPWGSRCREWSEANVMQK